ncbi:anthrax toxin-like adenylyl cyclase domain-containing protein [Candidatus Fukatsuia endosymbiont of Drepanosiphum platanoidis]
MTNSQQHHSFSNFVPVIEGEDAIKASGIVDEHVKQFIKLAKRKDTFFIFRPVNGLSTSLIKQGAATKGMEVHGKSADWGPMAGYIPFDQDLSKQFGNHDAVIKGNANNVHSINDSQGSIKKTILRIDMDRLKELQDKGILNWQPTTGEIIILHKGADTYQFRLNKQDDNNYTVDYRTLPTAASTLNETFTWRPVEVIGKEINGITTPLTADYDLFMVAPKLQNVVDLKTLGGRKHSLKEITQLISEQGLGQIARRQSDTEKGRLPVWLRDDINDLNRVAKEAGYQGGTLVNHGSEMDNPFPEQDQRLFVITPEGKTFLTTRWEDTQQVIRDIHQQGYIVYRNRSYNSLSVTTSSDGQQQVKMIVWGDSLPSLNEFDKYITEFIKIVDSGEILPGLNNIRNVLAEYYLNQDKDLSEQNKKIFIIKGQFKQLLNEHGLKSENIKIALNAMYQCIDIYERIVFTPQLMRLVTQIDHVLSPTSQVTKRFNTMTAEPSVRTELPSVMRDQTPAAPISIFELKRATDGTYILINEVTPNGKIPPDGKYFFVNPIGKNAGKIIVAHEDDAQGHSSLTVRHKDSSVSFVDAESVYYAGELTFSNGELLEWTNESGHYKPPIDHATQMKLDDPSLLSSEKFRAFEVPPKPVDIPPPVPPRPAHTFSVMPSVPVTAPTVRESRPPLSYSGEPTESSIPSILYQIVVVQAHDEDAMRAAGQWLKEDQGRRFLIGMHGEHLNLYSPNGNPADVPQDALQAFRRTIALTPNPSVSMLFIGEKDVSGFVKAEQVAFLPDGTLVVQDDALDEQTEATRWNGQSLDDTQKMILGFINENLTGIRAENIQVKLGQITGISDLDADNEPLPFRSSVTVDYIVPLTTSAEGHIIIQDLVEQAPTPRQTGMPGGNAGFNHPVKPIQPVNLPMTPVPDNLPTKLHRTTELLDQVADGRTTIQSLDMASRDLLTEAFHLSDGQLDSQKLLLHAHSPENRQAWDKAIRQLLQDPATYNEQANLSLQDALAQQQHLHQQQQQRAREFFQAGANTQKVNPGVETNTHLIPPSYSLRKGIDSGRDSDAWSLAFLDAKQAGKTQYDIFSAGLTADAGRRARLIDGSASGSEMAYSDYLHGQFEQLKNSSALSVDNPTIFTRHNVQDLFGATPAAGAYLLKGTHHSVALHIHQSGSGYTYSLYDPQVGSVDLTALSTGEHRPALHGLLDNYLQGTNAAGQTRSQQYGIEKTGTRYAFAAYQVNIEQARALTPLGEFQTSLNNEVAARTLLSSVTLDGVTLPTNILLDMGAIFEGKPRTLEHFTDTDSASLKTLRFRPQQLHDFLTKNNLNDPAFEPGLRLIRQRMNGIDGDTSPLLARGLLQEQKIAKKTLALLGKVNRHTLVNTDGTLTVKPTLMPSLQPKSRWHRVSNVTGYAGLGMSGLGYYLGYKAIAGYEEALKQQGLTPEKRQQLEFERNFAIASINTNFAVDIGQYGLSRMTASVSSSAAKLGGNMATKARFIKVGGAALSLVGVGFDIYGAYRSFSQLATETDPDIRQDLIVSGSLSVAGAAVGLAVTGAFIAGGTAAVAAGPIGLAVGGVLMLAGLGYSAARQVKEIEKHIYLTVDEKWNTGWRVFWGSHPSKAIQDKMAETQRSVYRETCDEFLRNTARSMMRERGITPIYHYVYSGKDFDLVSHPYWQLDSAYVDYYKALASRIEGENLEKEKRRLGREYALEIGDFEATKTGEYYYTPVFKEVDDYVVAASGSIKNAVRFDNLANGAADGIVLFNLGDGNDSAFGYKGRKNTFLGGKGKKHYVGDTLNDLFYLGNDNQSSATSDFEGSRFYGKAGEDTLIIAATPSGISGYSIDLREELVCYYNRGVATNRVAIIRDIEHIMGHATLVDRIVGDAHNNQLNGQGGYSTLFGMGGNDILTLEQGRADGGTEEDSYIILQNASAENAEIAIIDTGSASAENNHVLLKHSAPQIQSIALVKKDRAWVNEKWVNRDNYTLRILLANDNGTSTQLDLEDAYQRSVDSRQLQAQNRYSLTTGDGIQIDTTSWPETLTVADKKTVRGVESWSLPVLSAQYVVLLDNRKPSNRSFDLSREIDADALPALKADIAKINTVIGDATLGDWIQGDEANNQLNGQGGYSVLYGMGGNDILTLEQGWADGGTEEDSYIILQNIRTENAEITIIDTGSAVAENNHLVLKQDAQQIQSIILMIKNHAWVNGGWQNRDNYTLRILLANDNGTTTQLDLEDAYQRSEDGKQLKLHNRYSLTTRDGLQIDTNSWPKTLQVDDKTTNESGLCTWSLPVLSAQYVPIFDSKRSAFLGSAAAEQSMIELIQKNAQGQSEITVGGQKTVLPKSMTLVLGDTAYKDTIEGDDSNNALSSVQGNDHLKGKAGSDVYHLYHTPNISKTLTIDNEDLTTNPAIDVIILHSVSMDQLNTVIHQNEGDLVLGATIPNLAVGILELRLRHFMQDKRYQHAVILDKTGDYYLVEKGEDDKAHIYPAYFDQPSGEFKRGERQDNLQTQATSGDDRVTLSNAALLLENTFRALAGKDTVFECGLFAADVQGIKGAAFECFVSVLLGCGL